MTDPIQFTGTREEFLAKAREMMTEEDIERAWKAQREYHHSREMSYEQDGMRAAIDAALQTPHKAKT